MTNLRVSTAQFENKSGDKDYNLSVIDRLSAEAASKGSQAIAFHECSVTGYTFARHLSKGELLDIAEFIPSGPSGIIYFSLFQVLYQVSREQTLRPQT